MAPRAATTETSMDLLTVGEVAVMLRMSKVTVYRIVESRKIRFYKLQGGLRFNRVDVDAYLQSNCVEPIQLQ